MAVKPVLYSFRRCPYAIRARLAIRISGVRVELREVVLSKKPQAMLNCSPKGTVPVLQLADGRVIDESLDIMLWALGLNDPQTWLGGSSEERALSMPALALINEADGAFKTALDHYKYADRHPEHPAAYYRQQGEQFLRKLNTLLMLNKYLLAAKPSCVDMAIFPFVRQFAHVDKDWFFATPYQALQAWLKELLATELLNSVMQKYKPWKEGSIGPDF